MAYNVRQLNVLDRKPSTGVGVGLPFNNPAVFKTVYTTKEQVKYNIINYLLTDKGERIFNQSFGAGLRSRLFEQISEASNEALEEYVKLGVETYFPDILVTSTRVLSEPDQNIIYVDFSYRLPDGSDDEIFLTLQNGQT